MRLLELWFKNWVQYAKSQQYMITSMTVYESFEEKLVNLKASEISDWLHSMAEKLWASCLYNNLDSGHE